MKTLQFAPVTWMLVTEQDYRGFLKAGGRSLQGGFAEAASAQGVYFEPGTVSQARMLRSQLRGIGELYPTVDQVRRAINSVHAPLYKLESNGFRWHLRNRSEPRWSAPFEGHDWLMLVEAPSGWCVIRIHGAVERALQLLPWLDGTHSPQSITDAVVDLPEAVRLLRDLVALGVVSGSAKRQADLTCLPPFQFLGHSGFLVRDGADMLVVDPMLVPSTRVLANHPLLEPTLAAASAILITHNHWDHLHYPTLTRLPRDIRLLVPRVRRPTFANPPMAGYLRALGFTHVEERSPGEVVELGGLTLRCVPFRGESFGLNSAFDGLTYHIRFGNHTLYGSVDACFDETGDMESTIADVASWGPLDLFLFGSSGQRHDPPFLAGGLRHFSNELEDRPDLVRYHPTVADAERWARQLRPRALVPYAQFLFTGAPSEDVDGTGFLAGRDIDLGVVPARHRQWADDLTGMARRLERPLHLFQPMQGIRFGRANYRS